MGRCTGSIGVMMLLVALTALIAYGAVRMKPNSQAVISEWSDLERGLCGRLQVEIEDLDLASRYAVYLELRNDSPEPIAVTDRPRVGVRLSGREGKAVSPAHLPMSGPVPNAQAAVIPRGAALRVRIDMQTVGVPPKETGMVLLALGGQSWTLSAGEYVLTVNVTFDGVPGAPRNRWSGQLKVPPVALMVPRQ
jgi:hypothetical protein